VPPEHVRALIVAGRLPPPGDDELVPPDYLPQEPDPEPASPPEWQQHLDRELRRFRDGQRRVLASESVERRRQREQQLMRMGSASWGAALALLMQGRLGLVEIWLDRAASLYRLSLADAEPGSWGRSIGALKSRLLAGDGQGARREAVWTIELGAAEAASSTAAHAAALSYLVLGRADGAAPRVEALRAEESFPAWATASLAALVDEDGEGYIAAVTATLRSFEERGRYLENVPVADTVLVYQALARARGLAVPLRSALLPERVLELADSPQSNRTEEIR
jgi:hypothetical protein